MRRPSKNDLKFIYEEDSSGSSFEASEVKLMEENKFSNLNERVEMLSLD